MISRRDGLKSLGAAAALALLGAGPASGMPTRTIRRALTDPERHLMYLASVTTVIKYLDVWMPHMSTLRELAICTGLTSSIQKACKRGGMEMNVAETLLQRHTELPRTLQSHPHRPISVGDFPLIAVTSCGTKFYQFENGWAVDPPDKDINSIVFGKFEFDCPEDVDIIDKITYGRHVYQYDWYMIQFAGNRVRGELPVPGLSRPCGSFTKSEVLRMQHRGVDLHALWAWMKSNPLLHTQLCLFGSDPRYEFIFARENWGDALS